MSSLSLRVLLALGCGLVFAYMSIFAISAWLFVHHFLSLGQFNGLLALTGLGMLVMYFAVMVYLFIYDSFGFLNEN